MAPYETLLPYSSPRNAITIKANVCDLAQEPLRAAGLDCRRRADPVPRQRTAATVPERMATALASIGRRP